jgi:hypothetical protein
VRRIAALLLVAALAACGGGGGDGGPAVALPTEAEPNDAPEEATVLEGAFPLAARGEISAGDVDQYLVEVPGAGELSVRLELPSGTDHDLALESAGAGRIATARADNREPDVGATERLFARVGPGSYRVLVIGVEGSGGYELAVDLAPAGVPSGDGGVAVGSMRRARCFHGAAPVPGGGAVVGGGTTNAGSRSAALLSSLSSTEVFDPGTGEFTDGPGLGSARFGVTATALADGRVLFAGGDVGGTAAVYDPGRGVVTRGDIPLAGGNRFLHTATLLPDGRVLLAGGVRLVIDLPPRAEPLASTTIFDPKTRATTAGPPLRAARASHAACLLPDGRVLLTGGEGRRDSEVVDVRDGASESVAGPSLSGVRDDHTATTLADGRVLVTGGQDAGGRSRDSAEILEEGAFRLLPDRLSVGRSDHLAVALPDGRVLLIGGESDPGGNDDAILGSVDVFDPATDRIAPGPDLAVPRDDSRAVLLLDGTVLVTGGEDESSLAIPDAERYSVR